MDIAEYEKVKDYTYLQYCDYLQAKYGIPKSYYFTKSFNPCRSIKRTSEGLLVHHKMEDREILLSNPEQAKTCPYEWQAPINLVYCDYLEHLYLHVLSSEYSQGNWGIMGGTLAYLVPELNDLYSGWQTNQAWRKNCHSKVINDVDVYILLVKRIMNIMDDITLFRALKRSYNEQYGLWDNKKNEQLYSQFGLDDFNYLIPVRFMPKFKKSNKDLVESMKLKRFEFIQDKTGGVAQESDEYEGLTVSVDIDGHAEELELTEPIPSVGSNSLYCWFFDGFENENYLTFFVHEILQECGIIDESKIASMREELLSALERCETTPLIDAYKEIYGIIETAGYLSRKSLIATQNGIRKAWRHYSHKKWGEITLHLVKKRYSIDDVVVNEIKKVMKKYGYEDVLCI